MAGMGKKKIPLKDRPMPNNKVKEPRTPFLKVEAFGYVLPEKKKASVCFLSKKERETLPLRGPTRFETEHAQERWPNVSPNSYEKPTQFIFTPHKPTSLEAVLGVDSKRFPKRKRSKGPSPASFNLGSFPRPVKPNKYPFNSSSTRMPKDQNQIPGVGTYNIAVDPSNWRIPFTEIFGTKKTMIPAVEVKCYIINVDVCMVCQAAPPKGDYWKYEDKEKEEDQVLCRACMAKKSRKWHKKREKEYKVFQRIRDCGFMHIHEKTKYKIYLINPKELVKHQRKEAYLARYYKD